MIIDINSWNKTHHRFRPRLSLHWSLFHSGLRSCNSLHPVWSQSPDLGWHSSGEKWVRSGSLRTAALKVAWHMQKENRHKAYWATLKRWGIDLVLGKMSVVVFMCRCACFYNLYIKQIVPFISQIPIFDASGVLILKIYLHRLCFHSTSLPKIQLWVLKI